MEIIKNILWTLAIILGILAACAVILPISLALIHLICEIIFSMSLKTFCIFVAVLVPIIIIAMFVLVYVSVSEWRNDR